MKKILVAAFLVFLALPVLADNSVQRKMKEEYLQNPSTVKGAIAVSSILLIWEDYQLSQKDKQADSIYNGLLKLKEKYCAHSITNDLTNCKYTTKIINNITLIGENNIFTNNEDFSRALQIWKSHKIIIDDKDINNLDKKILNIIIQMF